MLCASTAPVLPLPGYRLTDFLGKGGFGEVWKCEAPGGVFKAVKIVQGRADGLDEEHAAVDQEWSAFQHVKSFRHPFLISIDRADIKGPGHRILTGQARGERARDLPSPSHHAARFL